MQSTDASSIRSAESVTRDPSTISNHRELYLDCMDTLRGRVGRGDEAAPDSDENEPMWTFMLSLKRMMKNAINVFFFFCFIKKERERETSEQERERGVSFSPFCCHLLQQSNKGFA